MKMKPYQKNKPIQKKEKGQIIVILALVFIGLVAIVGLAIDMGYMYVSYSRLRRAVDGAALAATSQFREKYGIADLQKAAQEFLQLNEVGQVGSDPNTLSVDIEDCDTTPGDPELCTDPPRKLIRVTVTERVPLFFLSVVGLHEIPIKVSSIAEAASIDLVLLIDNSPSMALGNSGQEVDPTACNPSNTCAPFNAVKTAAKTLVDTLYASYDRVAIVTYSRYPKVELPLSGDLAAVKTKIDALKVYEMEGKCGWSAQDRPEASDPFPGDPDFYFMDSPCRLYLSINYPGAGDPGSTYAQMSCYNYLINGDARGCTVTNSGGGLKVAGNLLGGVYPAGHSYAVPETRETALWVVIWLTDGATNAGFSHDGKNVGASDNQTLVGTDPIEDSICPGYTWVIPQDPPGGVGNYRFCADLNARPNLADIAANPSDPYILGRHPKDPDYTAPEDQWYDADDYARDMVDFVTDPLKGQGAMMFTIGLGPQITSKTPYEQTSGLPAPGETLLQYAAEKGSGIYYAAPNATQLQTIFLAIANKIATRLSR
jgi:hypothetical protein